MDEVEDSREAEREVASPDPVIVDDHPERPEPEVAVEDAITDEPEGEPTVVEGASVDADGEVLIAEAVAESVPEDNAALLKAVIEAAIYITDEPLTPQQIASAVQQPLDRVKDVLNQLSTEYSAADRGLSVRELAGGYKMSTKPEHHEAIRLFVKRLQPPLKLSLAALETLAVVAYKQPITAPEIMEVRGVQGTGVLKTLLDRRLIATAGRKSVIGKPIMYKTTREFLIHFGLSSLAELPTLKEFEELGRMALGDGDELAPVPAPPQLTIDEEPKLEEQKVDA